MTLEFSITSVHLPFWPECKRIVHHLLVLRIPVVLKKCPWFLRPSSAMLMVCHLGVRPCLCTFDTGFQLRILKMTKIYQRQKMNFHALVPCFIDHLRQLPRKYIFQNFLFFFHCSLCRHFLNAWGIVINLSAMWSSWYLLGTPSNRILIGSSDSATKAYLVLFSQYRGRFHRCHLLELYKALPLASEFLIFYSWIPHLPDHYRVEVFR